MALTRINNQALTNVTSAGLPSGTVLQVKQVKLSSVFESGSTSFVDTGLSVTITPSSTNSKILVSYHLTPFHTGTTFQGEYKVLRGSTDPASISGGRMWSSDGYYSSATVESTTCQYLDSPSSTSALTYKIQFRTRHSGGTVRLGRDWNNDDAGINSITVMEIAG